MYFSHFPMQELRLTKVHRTIIKLSSISCTESHTYFLEDGLTCHNYNPLKLSTTCYQTNLSLAERMPRYQQNTNISSQTMPQRTSGTYTILNQSYHERKKSHF
jgi:hypothetical protein